MARPGRPPKVDRSDVVNAAAHVFAENGYYQSRLEDVADTLNITKGAIYYHFPTKDSLRQEVHAALMNAALSAARAALAEGGTPAELLRRLVRVHFDVTQQQLPNHATTWIQRSSRHDEQERDSVRQLRLAYEKLWIDTIRSCGVVHGEEPNLLSKFIFGALNWIHVWYRGGDSMTADELNDYAARFILGGVAGTLNSTSELLEKVGTATLGDA